MLLLVQAPKIDTGTGIHGNKRTDEDRPNYSNIQIGQTNEESSRDLRRCYVTQTLVRNHRLTLKWKTQKGINSTSCLVSLFNGISTFVGYLMPNVF